MMSVGYSSRISTARWARYSDNTPYAYTPRNADTISRWNSMAMYMRAIIGWNPIG